MRTTPSRRRTSPCPSRARATCCYGSRYAASSHTDLHTVEGDLALAKRPVVPGHQIVGRVERRGQDASRFAPAGWLVPEALRVLDKGGTLALAGIHMSPIPELDYAAHLYHERTVRSVANSTRRDSEEFLELAAAIPVTTRTTRYALGEANEALGALKAGEIGGAAVLEVA
ncbi:MAG: alcohol dehydrogenase catalytic domain-containing protein [bacterium]